MSSSKINQRVFPSHFLTRRGSDLFQSPLSRPYIKTNNVSFYSTKENGEINKEKENLEKNESVKEIEKTIVEETGKHGNESEKTSPSSSRTFSNKSSPYLDKFTALAYYFVGGLAFFISGDNLYSWYVNRRNERLLNKTMEKGTRPEVGISGDEYVSRPVIAERLKKIIQPYKGQSFYNVVCGEHGTGKTTLIKIASREVGQGVIYVDTPADIEDFGKAFGRALNFTFEEHISWSGQLMRKVLGNTNYKFEDPKWKRAMEAFKRASEVYKAKHGKPPVIVYDNVSRMVHKNPEILDILQDDAKDNADDRKYIAVFVSSEGSVPRRMESRSAWSRADKPVMEIGDLSEKESMDYLIDKRKINSVEAKKLYELVGGRIVDLKSVAGKFLAGQSFEVIKKSILGEVEKKFNTAQLLRKQLHHEVGKRAINALLDSKTRELKLTAFMEYFNDYKEANVVLESNVFAYHPEKYIVTFQSQSIESYIRENTDIFVNLIELTPQEGKRKMY
ncbi:4208_t:CDS:2 [Ambispora gerdemannii]|uniref:4208_t:CDS:1 n=1 Tax=Ambispora gerdemannii TaxID=144530 RepID=A0A9N9DWI2_9GLOM|nr:4208_t:CDS:2 [Ambispora gerdemannii]